MRARGQDRIISTSSRSCGKGRREGTRRAGSLEQKNSAVRYGLRAAVLGTDLQRARRVASQLRAGRMVINSMTDDPQAPWGGFKYSGVGREYGKYGIEAFLE